MILCHRDYSGNSLLSKKEINGLPSCPNCEKPVVCHNKPLEDRVLFWALSGDTGTSSETMCAYFTGNPPRRFAGAPSDVADRGRCIRLLELAPEWISRLDELIVLDVGEVSINGAAPVPYSETEHSWTYQVPLIRQEGRL